MARLQGDAGREVHADQIRFCLHLEGTEVPSQHSKSLLVRMRDAFNRLLLIGHSILSERLAARLCGIGPCLDRLFLNDLRRADRQVFHILINGVAVDVKNLCRQSEKWIMSEYF